MAVDAFERLARKLDSLPAGFPKTTTGVELRILRAIFSPEDAAMALRLKPFPETAETIARRLKRPVEEMRGVLDAMADCGQIGSFWLRGRHVYAVVPFVVGIYEFQLDRLTPELAGLFEEYVPTLLKTVGGPGPALARVIPVNAKIEARAQTLPYEDLRQLLEKGRTFRIAQCICRKERALEGHPCSHTQETCLSFSREENALENVPSWGRPITREEAFELVKGFEEEGLVHCTYNTRDDPFFVCNCCSCCCGFLRGVKEFGAPNMLVHASVVSRIDAETCIVCGQCAPPRCPMDAIAETGGSYLVDSERCIGCGVCLTACPADAITLQPRPAGEVTEPPRTVVHWNLDRVTARRGALHGFALRGWLAWEVAKAKLAREWPCGPAPAARWR
jgi:Pyruvate/2-oxoacid:ferredoxin oxidoreductase delta subunit